MNNNIWIDEEGLEIRKLRFLDRKRSEVIDLTVERQKLYEVRELYGVGELYELEELARRIERIKEDMELILAYETLLQNDRFMIAELISIIRWVNEEQEKYKL